VVLNVGEGRLRRGGDQRRSFEIAAGSASEVRSALDVAEAWGWTGDVAESRALIERVNSMLWVLTRGRPREPWVPVTHVSSGDSRKFR